MFEETGWIKLHRSVQDHWIFKDPVKFKCWIDILFTVNYEDKKINIGNHLFDCKRGQSLLSIQSWADRWRVSKSAARNLLNLLQSDNMITLENVSISTRLTVCNYEYYQGVTHESKPDENRKAYTTKEYKNDKNYRGNKLPLVEREVAFLNLVNKITNRQFKTLDPKTRKQFADLLSDGYTGVDFKKTITIALSEMTSRGKGGYLTPEFITRPIEFAKYFNMPITSEKDPDIYNIPDRLFQTNQ